MTNRLTIATQIPSGAYWLVVLALVYVYFLARILIKRESKPNKPLLEIIKWLLLSGVLIFPITYLGRFEVPTLPVATSLGFGLKPQIYLFSLLPATLALGTLGLNWAALTTVLTIGFQVLILKQEPFLVFAYLTFLIIFADLLSRRSSQTRRPFFWPIFGLALKTYGFTFPVLALNQAMITLASGERSLLELFRQAFVVGIAYLPSVAIAAVAVYVLRSWFSDTWKLSFTPPGSDQIGGLERAIYALNKIAEGDLRSQEAPENASEDQKSLFTAIENLRLSIAARNARQERLWSITPTAQSEEGLETVLDELLDALLATQASSARIVLYNDEIDALDQTPRMRVGKGEKSHNYAYLDFAISEKIGSQDILILSDLHPEAFFGVAPGTPAPQALIAAPLRDEGKSVGLLWIGFEKSTWFNNEDISAYQKLFNQVSAILSNAERLSTLHSENLWLKNAFEALAMPVTIIDSDGLTILENKAATQARIRKANSLQHDENDGQEEHGDLRQERTIRQTISGSGAQAGTLITKQPATANELHLASQERELANLAQGLRSPLKMLDGYLQLLKNIGNLNDQQDRFLVKINENLDYINALLARSANGAGLHNGTPSSTTFDVRQLIESVVSLVGLQAQQAKVQLVTDFGQLRNPFMVGDYILIRQAVYGLLENSIRYSNHGGQVKIRAYKDYDWLHLEIEDQGKGIAPLDQAGLFGPESYGDPNDEANQASTLAVVKRIIESHEGRLRIDSSLGRGTSIQVDLPLKRPMNELGS